MNCRFDGLPVTDVFADLGASPPSNSFLSEDQLSQPEPYYPLKAYVSPRTFLVQVDELKKATEIFSDEYVYYSSFSSSWLTHCRQYASEVVPRFRLGLASRVIEIASNDGYLLQYFAERKIPTLGIEPTANTAAVARQKGIETLVEFFGHSMATKLASQGIKANLLVANNVLAHVPDLNDFIRGMKAILDKDGVITIEFPHLLRLIEQVQFDTIYHEHFSYFSLYTANLIFRSHGLVIFDVDELPTHGGSLRIYVKHAENELHNVTETVAAVIEKEKQGGLQSLAVYEAFNRRIEVLKIDFLDFLIRQKKDNKKVYAYGAAAKGNTLLNYSGVHKDLVHAVADLSPHKQGKFLPGSRIPVISPGELIKAKPDFVLILPWNIKDEIITQLSGIGDWHGKFVVAVPEITIL